MTSYVLSANTSLSRTAAEALEPQVPPPLAALREDVEPHGPPEQLRQAAQPPGEGLLELLRQRVAAAQPHVALPQVQRHLRRGVVAAGAAGGERRRGEAPGSGEEPRRGPGRQAPGQALHFGEAEAAPRRPRAIKVTSLKSIRLLYKYMHHIYIIVIV